MPETTVTLLTRPGCHLCDEARDVVVAVVESLAAAGSSIELEERSIVDAPVLEERFRDDIPVVLTGQRVLARWRVDPDELRASLAAR